MFCTNCGTELKAEAKNRMEDSNEARLYAKELFLKFLKSPRTIHTQDERNEMIDKLSPFYDCR